MSEPNRTKLAVGTPIRFLKTLDAPANEEHPAIVYARKEETGVVTGHNDFEGYMVKTDHWPSSFGAKLGTEFEVLTCWSCKKPLTEKLDLDLAELPNRGKPMCGKCRSQHCDSL